MNRKTAVALVCLALTAPTSALAGEAVEAARRAEDLVAKAQYADALEAADQARDAIWNAAPLFFRRALFVASDPAGFGIFDIRESNSFKTSEPLVIYSEPVGYAFGRDGDLHVIDLGLDFVLKDKDGKELAKQEGFANFTLKSRVPNKEFMAKLKYNFSGLPAGDYTVTTIAHDKNSGKTGEFTLDFTIVD